MKTLTEQFEEIIDAVGTVYMVESTVVYKLIEAVKKRDDYLTQEDENVPLTTAGVKTRMKETL